MENASKALLIAAGILIAVMLLALVFTYIGNMSGYFTEQHNATRLKQLMEFNSKFENYSNKTVRGNELVSIMNMIVDYNNLQADQEGYDRVIIKIDLQHLEEQLQDENASWGGPSSFKVNSHGYITNQIADQDIKDISELSATILSLYKDSLPWLTEARLQKLSANIDSIAYENSIPANEVQDYKKNRIIKLRDLLPMVYDDDETPTNAEINDIIEVTCLYNEFTKFKRAVFKCTNIEYNTHENGRVNQMEFEVVTEIDSSGRTVIKFD